MWQTPIDGLGWSSPVVWGNRIFLSIVVSDGESQEPRVGLYFPFGSPATTDERFPDPVVLSHNAPNNSLYVLG